MITPAQEIEMQARLARARGDLREVRKTVEGVNALEVEADLQEAIITYCRSKGWFVLYSRMDLPTTLPLGSPDFVIAANDGKTFWIECKRPGEKRKPAQIGVAMMLEKLKANYGLVYSFQQFLEIVK